MPSKKTQSRETFSDWVLPASIPFADLKGRDLEECVYWLLDSMGAKDLEWRTGGSGGGAPDGGRDLEAQFYIPTIDGELEVQKWWIECKGRAGTVDPVEVKSAVNNAMAIDKLDCVVIATNTQFSNPTRDWVKQWQSAHSKPKIKLWDHVQLERYLSHHPDVVLRLFSEALSLDGRFKAMESRFWNKIEYVTPKSLTELWKAREKVKLTPLGLFAVIANEFSNGNISYRPWAAFITPDSVLHVLRSGLVNFPYLVHRCTSAGTDQKVIIRTFAYLILAALDISSVESVTALISDSLGCGGDARLRKKMQEMLLIPIVNRLLSEMQDVCSSDCTRIDLVGGRALNVVKDEVDNYWLRLEDHGYAEPSQTPTIMLEGFYKPCVVGFPVDNDNYCPLFKVKPTVKNIGNLMAIIKRVAAFRKAQAAEKCQALSTSPEDPIEP
jgi:hypothetical protein